VIKLDAAYAPSYVSDRLSILPIVLGRVLMLSRDFMRDPCKRT
jgi:hypothetical protein